MDEIRPSFFSIYSNYQQSLLPNIQKTLSTMITENHETMSYCLIFFWLCSGLAKIIRPAAV